jgi:hypothetical protein
MLKITPSQHTSEGLGHPKRLQITYNAARTQCNQPNRSKDRQSQCGALSWLGSVREEHVEGLLGPARTSRMPTNLVEKLAGQQERLRRRN